MRNPFPLKLPVAGEPPSDTRPNPLTSILEDAVARYEVLAKEATVLRQDVRRLRDELLRRDADDALRGARCACTSYQRRFHVAMAVNAVLCVALAGIGAWLGNLLFSGWVK